MQEQRIPESWLLPRMWLLTTQEGLLGAPSPSEWTLCTKTGRHGLMSICLMLWCTDLAGV